MRERAVLCALAVATIRCRARGNGRVLCADSRPRRASASRELHVMQIRRAEDARARDAGGAMQIVSDDADHDADRADDADERSMQMNAASASARFRCSLMQMRCR